MQTTITRSYAPAKAFARQPTADGWEVIGMRDGRPVTGSFTTETRALAIQEQLNLAASHGRRALARALGCVDNVEVDEHIGETVAAFDYV